MSENVKDESTQAAEEAVKVVEAVEETVEAEAAEAAEMVDAAEAIEGAEEAEAAIEAEQDVEEEALAEEAPADEQEPAAEAADEPKKDSPAKKASGVGDLVAVGIIALILGILLCMPSIMSYMNNSDYDLSEGVAVKVNGVAIGEKEITDYVAGLRQSMGVEDDAAWAEWMTANGYTPETVREAVIQYYVSRELQIQAAKENDVTVSDEAIEEQINTMIEQFGGQEAFEEALTESGVDLDAYRENIRLGLQQQELAKKVSQDVEPASDEEVLSILKMYYPEEVSEDATSLDGLDEELVSYIREALSSSAVEQAYTEWMQNYEAQATIETTDMPEGLPYNVDLNASTQDASDAAEGK